jgi:hypothetical protein
MSITVGHLHTVDLEVFVDDVFQQKLNVAKYFVRVS